MKTIAIIVMAVLLLGTVVTLAAAGCAEDLVVKAGLGAEQKKPAASKAKKRA